MYTVIGMFDNSTNAKNAKQKLTTAGISASQIDYSANATADDLRTTYSTSYNNYQEDTNTGGFWDWLFGNDTTERRQYSAVGTRTDVISVHCKTKDEALRVSEILDGAGALDINDYARQYNEKYTTAAKTAGRTVAGTETIPVIEEELHVGKRTVETGRVKVRSRIIEKPVSEELRLRQERVYVTTTPVNRPATEADFNTFKEGTIELTETAERAVVEKTANVVGEVKVGKDAQQITETVSDTVRETEVEVVEDTTNRIQTGKTTLKNTKTNLK